MKKLYIITGAKGHLASTIIKYLRETDCDIRGLILPCEYAVSDEKVTYYNGDVTDISSLDEIFLCDDNQEITVIHAAGIISIAEKVTPELHSVNVRGTENIISKCIESKVKRLVYVSSVHAIPEKEDNATIEEVSAFSEDWVVGAYASTKAEATRKVLEAEKKGLDTVVVHPSGIIGPYDSGNNHMVQLINMYISGKLPAGVIGGYDFVDVRDVAKGCILAAEKGKKGACYILSNRYFTVKELLGCMRRISGGKKKTCLPISLAGAFVPMFEWIAKVTNTRPLYTKYALYTLSSNGHFSHDRATSELGYKPRDMVLTLKDTIQWLKGKEVPLEL